MSNTSAPYPYLTFDNTKAALAYYQAVFGAEDVERLPVTKAAAEAMHIPSSVNYEDLTMHAVFTILGNWVYSSDNFNHDDQLTNSTRLLIDVDSGDAEMLKKAEALYHSFETDDSVTILMPLADQGWGAKMGMVTDKYNVTWMLQIRKW